MMAVTPYDLLADVPRACASNASRPKSPAHCGRSQRHSSMRVTNSPTWGGGPALARSSTRADATRHFTRAAARSLARARKRSRRTWRASGCSYGGNGLTPPDRSDVPQYPPGCRLLGSPAPCSTAEIVDRSRPVMWPTRPRRPIDSSARRSGIDRRAQLAPRRRS